MLEGWTSEVVRYGTKIIDFMKTYHYLQGAPAACKFCFELKDAEGNVKGYAIYNNFSRREAQLKYPGCLELIRFCLVPDCPKNTASFFMAKNNKILSKNKVQGIISYCDPNVGHQGTIYKAANFKEIGKSGASYHYLDVNDLRVNKKGVWDRSRKTGLSEKEQASKEGLRKIPENPKIIFFYPILVSSIEDIIKVQEMNYQTIYSDRMNLWIVEGHSTSKSGNKIKIDMAYFQEKERADSFRLSIDNFTKNSISIIDNNSGLNDWDESIHICIKFNNRHYYMDAKDFVFIQTKKWSTKSVYLKCKDMRAEEQSFHRMVIETKDGFFVDHINGLKNDNRSCNLRLVHPSVNNHNRTRINVNGFRGVKAIRGGYEASQHLNGKCKYIGRFDTAEQAAVAYDKQSVLFFGSAALTNFPIENYEIPDVPLIDFFEVKTNKRRKEFVQCETEDCVNVIKSMNNVFCELCIRKIERRRAAKEVGNEVKQYTRVSEKQPTCEIDGCESESFTRNLCSLHYKLKREEEGYVKPKKQRSNCTVEGCDKVRFKHKEGLCKNHWNQKHGLNPKITGRPATQRCRCSVCGEDASAATRLCKKCYTQKWREEKKLEAIQEREENAQKLDQTHSKDFSS